MFPGVNPKQLNQLMKQMGMKQEELESTEVIIRTPEGDIIVKNPKVTKMNVMGQTTYQVSGEEQKATSEISKEDIELVMEQAKVSKEYAKAALEDANGDIAKAITLLEK